jgi:hypothetical protein
VNITKEADKDAMALGAINVVALRYLGELVKAAAMRQIQLNALLVRLNSKRLASLRISHIAQPPRAMRDAEQPPRRGSI